MLAARSLGSSFGVGDAPAEQQPVIAAAPEIVENPVRIGDCLVVPDERPGAFVSELLRGHDETRYRHHGVIELADQPVDVGVAGDDHVFRRDLTRRRPCPGLAFPIAARHPCLLVDQGAGLACRAGEPVAVVEGVKMSRPALAQRPEIGPRGEFLLELRLVEELQVAVTLILPFLLQFPQAPELALLRRAVEIAPFEVAFDAVSLDPVFDQNLGFFA